MIFPPAPPIHLQDTYMNDKHLESALLYKHRASEVGQEFVSLESQRFFFLYLVLEAETTKPKKYRHFHACIDVLLLLLLFLLILFQFGIKKP